MKRTLLLSLLLGTFSFAGANFVHAEGTITLATTAPYSADNNIRKKIVNSCKTLGNKLSGFIKSNSEKKGLTIELADNVDPSSAPSVLQVEITDAVSQGNAFIGHRKFVEVQGTLYRDGEPVASFDAQRSSGGGFAAGYKSSCAVLARCAKALGKDISTWLVNPVDGAELGE